MKNLLNIWIIKSALIYLSFFSMSAFADDLNGDYLIRQAFQEILQKGDPNQIEALIAKTIQEFPKFKLANFLKAEFYSAMAGRPVATSEKVMVRDSELPHNLMEEAKLRIASPMNISQIRPLQILKISDNIDYVILIDATLSRAYIFKNQNGEPIWDRDFFITMGQLGVGKKVEGDHKTPLGLYRVEKEVDKKNLTPFYGIGALKLDFPNSYDSYLEKSGSGIWLHGVPQNVYNRPSRASDGCIVFTNSDLKYILKISKGKNIQVLVSNSVKWMTVKDWRFQYNKLANNFSSQLVSENNTKKIKKDLTGIYVPESESQIILEKKPLNSSLKVYREYWEKSGSSWVLKFETRYNLS